MASTLNLTIPAGQTLSNPIEIPPILRITRIGLPADWSPAAPITFLIASINNDDNNDFRDLYRVIQSVTGEWIPYEVVVPQIAPGSILSLPSGMGTSLGFLKIRSGTRSHPIAQAANRVFTLVLDSA
jgi:hypothetical protein